MYIFELIPFIIFNDYLQEKNKAYGDACTPKHESDKDFSKGLLFQRI